MKDYTKWQTWILGFVWGMAISSVVFTIIAFITER